MPKSLDQLRRTTQDGFRAKIVELVSPAYPPLDPGGEPIVRVKLDMPLSDARRFGVHLYDWIEIVLPAAVEPDPPQTRIVEQEDRDKL